MLRTRIVTGTLGVAAVLAMLLWGALPWQIAVWVATLLAMAEFTSMLGFQYWNPVSLWAYVLLSVIEWWPSWQHLLVVQCIVALTLLIPVVAKNRVTLAQSGMVLIGALYIGYGGESLAMVRRLPHGWAWLVMILVCIWMTDSTAYFVGRAVQGPKLWPSISPSKTVSGAIGGLVGSIAGAIVFGLLALRGTPISALILIGLVVSVLGQLGDLVESAYKRSSGVKDSGQLLPGHGGMLDRVDSLLFAAPFAYAFISTHIAAWLH